MWRDAGKPRHGQLFKLMSVTRARFKYSLRFIKRHENQIRGESLADKLSDKDVNGFWKEVRKINNAKTPLPNNIDDAVGSNEITEVWKKHFISLFNCLQDNINDVKCVCTDEESIVVTVDEIAKAVESLDSNKTCGLDGIYAEHLKCCSNRLLPLLSLCFTALTWIPSG